MLFEEEFLMDVENYLDQNFTSRAYAEKAMADFITLLRRFRKFDKGTSDAHVIYNLVIGIENTFCREFIDHMLESRFEKEHRLIYGSCRAVREKNRKIPHNVQFRVRLEAEILRNSRGI
uniref:Uncharacterized protein n=2 Tax=unclassified Caudoviricetes TaxID=2788787 RepID=A0AAU8HYX2_9CAUD